MTNNLIKVLANMSESQRKFDEMTAEEKKEYLDNYKPSFYQSPSPDIETNIESGSILDLMIFEEELGFPMKIFSNRKLTKFLVEYFRPNIDKMQMTQLQKKFLKILVACEYDLSYALEKTDATQSKKMVPAQVKNKNGGTDTVMVREGYTRTDQKAIMDSLIKKFNHVFLIKYIRKNGLTKDLEYFGIKKKVVDSQDKFTRMKLAEEQEASKVNETYEIETQFLKDAEDIINNLSEIKFPKWPGYDNIVTRGKLNRFRTIPSYLSACRKILEICGVTVKIGGKKVSYKSAPGIQIFDSLKFDYGTLDSSMKPEYVFGGKLSSPFVRMSTIIENAVMLPIEVKKYDTLVDQYNDAIRVGHMEQADELGEKICALVRTIMSRTNTVHIIGLLKKYQSKYVDTSSINAIVNYKAERYLHIVRFVNECYGAELVFDKNRYRPE